MFFFCFRQMTAYDMRISDWSSDVCSSDLPCGVTAIPVTKPPWPRSSARTAPPGASSARPQSPASNSLVDVDRLANNGLTHSIHQGKNQGPGHALAIGPLPNLVDIAQHGHPTAAAAATDRVVVKTVE